ncbi:MAG: hypothetical protein WA621_13700, partial [Candidatus Acidiferrum sp.]
EALQTGASLGDRPVRSPSLTTHQTVDIAAETLRHPLPYPDGAGNRAMQPSKVPNRRRFRYPSVSISQ